jgi:hypothetical protein
MGSVGTGPSSRFRHARNSLLEGLARTHTLAGIKCSMSMRFPTRPATICISCAVIALIGFVLTDIVNPAHAWITVLVAIAIALMVLLTASIVERHLHR